MAAWDMSMNAPAVGEDYIVTVEKPSDNRRVAGGATGRGTLADPYKLKYLTSDGSSNSMDGWRLEPRRTANRRIYISVIVDGADKKKITPTVQDSSDGGRR